MQISRKRILLALALILLLLCLLALIKLRKPELAKTAPSEPALAPGYTGFVHVSRDAAYTENPAQTEESQSPKP